MKRVGIFFILVLLGNCIEKETSIDNRRILSQVNDEIAYLALEKTGTNETGFFFELQKPNEITFLSVLGRDIICDTLSIDMCLTYHWGYLRHVNTAYDLSQQWRSPRLWYRISGDIKEYSPNDKLVGHPFVLTKAERILSCPVSYDLISGEFPIVDTYWKFVGFYEDKGIIFSHPTCEFNNERIKFSSISTSDSTVFVGSLDVFVSNWRTFRWRRAFWIYPEKKKIILKSSMSYYGHPNDNGSSTHFLESILKMDSLAYLLGPFDTIDYVLENNILKLKNSKKKSNAMFVAN